MGCMLRKYPDIIDEFMPSPEMKAYLKDEELSPYEICRMVFFAPMVMEKKYDGLKRLLKLGETEKDKNLIEECVLYIRNIEDAYREYENDGVYTVEIGDFSDNAKDTEMNLDSVYSSYESAVKAIRKEVQECEYTRDDYTWYEISKWEPSTNGPFDFVCKYIFVLGELWYIEMDYDYYEDSLNHVPLFDMREIRLPVPFKAGDLIDYDGYPFTPKNKFLMLTIGDNSDCCCLQGLARNEENTWDYGAVKHCMFGYRAFYMLSPLYTATKWKGKPEELDDIFSRLLEYIGNDESKAERIYDNLFCDRTTDEDMIEYIKMDFDKENMKKYRARKLKT